MLTTVGNEARNPSKIKLVTFLAKNNHTKI